MRAIAWTDGDPAVLTRYAATCGAALIIALVAHWMTFGLARRAAARTTSTTIELVLRRIAAPSRLLFVIVAFAAARPTMGLGPIGTEWYGLLAGLLAPAAAGWLTAAGLGAANDVMQFRADVSVADNLRARRKRTRAAILHQIALFLVLVVTVCLMLMSIPAVRTVGVTLAASAGIGALAIGAAAQPALKNLIAGIQMAFTEPIRLDDVVIVDGEWGRIEEIGLTYVVVAVWDQRRLVVPVSKFLDDSFQNWTRRSADLLGTAFIQVDRTADVGRLRERLSEIVAADPLWDGRTCGLQVTDVALGHLELRCLVSAADAGRACDLAATSGKRCPPTSRPRCPRRCRRRGRRSVLAGRTLADCRCRRGWQAPPDHGPAERRANLHPGSTRDKRSRNRAPPGTAVSPEIAI